MLVFFIVGIVLVVLAVAALIDRRRGRAGWHSGRPYTGTAWYSAGDGGGFGGGHGGFGGGHGGCGDGGGFGGGDGGGGGGDGGGGC